MMRDCVVEALLMTKPSGEWRAVKGGPYDRKKALDVAQTVSNDEMVRRSRTKSVTVAAVRVTRLKAYVYSPAVCLVFDETKEK